MRQWVWGSRLMTARQLSTRTILFTTPPLPNSGPLVIILEEWRTAKQPIHMSSRLDFGVRLQNRSIFWKKTLRFFSLWYLIYLTIKSFYEITNLYDIFAIFILFLSFTDSLPHLGDPIKLSKKYHFQLSQWGQKSYRRLFRIQTWVLLAETNFSLLEYWERLFIKLDSTNYKHEVIGLTTRA